MKIIEFPKENYFTLQPVGDLDANSSIHLDGKIQELIEKGHVNIHVDFTKVQYISSAGWGVFTFYYDEIQSKKGKIVMSGMNENVLDVFNVLGLYQLFKLANDDKEASTLF